MTDASTPMDPEEDEEPETEPTADRDDVVKARHTGAETEELRRERE